MDQYQYTRTKYKKDVLKNMHSALYKASKKEPITFVKQGKTVTLTTHHAALGLMLLNCYPSDREEAEKERWSYSTLIGEGSKRHQSFLKYYGESLWNEKTEDLAYFMLGDAFAPLLLQAWDTLPQFMYQQGMHRRSFRQPNAKASNYVRQLNFMITAVNTLPLYDLSLEERLEYNHVLGFSNTTLIKLLAVSKDEKWRTLFLDVAYNRHPKMKLNPVIIQTMLSIEDEQYWKAIADVLLAAQRQEGLRQSILENADAGHKDAFVYLMGVVLEHKLTRFSATLRAIETWVGLGWKAEKETTIKRFLQLGYDFVQSPEQIVNAIKSKDNAEVFMALWAQGVIDVDQCQPFLDQLWATENLEKQTLVLLFVRAAQQPEWYDSFGMAALQSNNKQLYAFGLPLLFNNTKHKDKTAFLEVLQTVASQLTEKEYHFTGKVFAWTQGRLVKQEVYGTMLRLIDRSDMEQVKLLVPFFTEFSVYQREDLCALVLKDYFTRRWERNKKTSTQAPTDFQRQFALERLSDRSEYVKVSAIETLKHAHLHLDELQQIEDLLARKSASLREQVIDLLLHKKDTTKASVERLLASKKIEQRLGGLDVVLQLKKQNQYTADMQQLVADFKSNTKLGNREEVLLGTIEDSSETYSVANGFGLYNPENLTTFPKPSAPTEGEFIDKRPDLFQKKKGLFSKKTTITYGLSKSVTDIEKDLEALKQLYLANTNYEYTIERDASNETVLLGNQLSYKKTFHPKEKKTAREQFEQFALYEVWESWWQDTKLTEFDLFWIMSTQKQVVKNKSLYAQFPKAAKAFEHLLPPKIKIPKIEGTTDRYYTNPLHKILQELQHVYWYPKALAYQLGASQYIASQADDSELTHIYQNKVSQYHIEYFHFYNLSEPAYLLPQNHPQDDALFKSWFAFTSWRDGMMRTLNKTLKQYPQYYQRHQYLGLIHTARAHQLGLLTDDDLMKAVLETNAIAALTQKKRPKREHILETYPFLQGFLDKARQRILDIELVRGDKATAVTHLATSIYQVYGMDTFFQIIKGIGKSTLNKGYIYSYNTPSKRAILSTLLKRCQPVAVNQDAFNAAAKALKLSEKRWVEFAMYAQAWSPYIRTYLGWEDEMESAIWWLHAHTNAHHSSETESEIAKYSPVTLAQFQNGSVDVAWFKDAYKTVGKKRWGMLYDAAKYITDGTGYTRAKLVADVLMSDKKIREITKRVKDKRNQDYLRVYGLVPLSKTTPEKDVLQRYLYVQQFLKESKQFGAQRQESEKLAAEIALENLARTAGYPDPIRLTWAMEGKQLQHILASAETLEFDGDVTVQLQITKGKPSLVVHRKGKLLKNVPAKLRKDKDIQELKGFIKALKAQGSRTRKSLEDAMVRQDAFLWSEIVDLQNHPIIQQLMQHIVLRKASHFGFPTADGLVTLDGEVQALAPSDEVYLAHPYDLYTAKLWENYQRYCFSEKVQQPFKQIFRELYIPTPDELHLKSTSKRYEGHQVQPGKTVALLKSRGWRVSYEEGLQKVYHREGVIAKIYALADWFSPADIESPTLETIQFLDKKTYKPMVFTELSPIIFSEVMRDLDLVVAVAHVGDVDPETSQSSVEMRGVLVRETARLFKLDNVSVEGKHVHIKGSMAEYSIHLGSAQVFQKPGRQLGVIPIHSQHRGRLFLPFADDDPKSAELLSKVLLFAKDHDIQDPTILQQLNLVKK